MKADDLLHELDTLDVLAAHDAVVLDVDCGDHDPHSIVVCDECDRVDVPDVDAEDCAQVANVLDMLSRRREPPQSPRALRAA